MNRTILETSMLMGARIFLQIIHEKHMKIDGIMMSIDDKPIYYNEIMKMVEARINEILDKMEVK